VQVGLTQKKKLKMKMTYLMSRWQPCSVMLHAQY